MVKIHKVIRVKHFIGMVSSAWKLKRSMTLPPGFFLNNLEVLRSPDLHSAAKKSALQFLLDVEISGHGDCSTRSHLALTFFTTSHVQSVLHNTASSFN
ncbi:hypothetical protein B9Z48_15105 [Limnohabitans sp. WS1]|nr:hypothetical protein B9Z48_15105 [Limnohabitans sp. WS1]